MNGRKADTAELAGRIVGPVRTAGAEGYEQEISGFQTAARREPDVVVGATGPDDVCAAVGFATAHDLPVAVQGTGHGLATMTGGLLITTSRMAGVTVDPGARTARFEAGASWADVVARTAPYGLAPLSGSAPGVCAMSYLLGGGMGLMARKYGYAADHVQALDVVTADGQARHVTAAGDADLFWALRGGRDNFGIATAAEIHLMPVERLYGGGLFFDAELAGPVLSGWLRWTADLPTELTTSLAVVPFPDVPALPEPLRGKHVVHIRVAYLGAADRGETLVAPLRTIGPRLLEGLREMPYSESGSICNDPTDPMPYFGSNAMFRDLDDDAISTLLDTAGPGAEHTFILELRHLGGAMSRPSAIPNSVGHRDAAFALGALSRLGPDDAGATAAAHAGLSKAMGPWTIGRCLNFTYGDLTPEDVATAYDADDFRRLVELKGRYDPGNLFRLNHNIPPNYERS